MIDSFNSIFLHTACPSFILHAWQLSYVVGTHCPGFYYDELAMPFPIMTRGLIIDVEQVEILKGGSQQCSECRDEKTANGIGIFL